MSESSSRMDHPSITTATDLLLIGKPQRRRSRSRRRHRSHKHTNNNNNNNNSDNDDESSSHHSHGSSHGSHDPLQKATRLLGRIIRPCLSYRARCAEAEAAPNQLVLDLCCRHPALALQRFPTHLEGLALSPLKFLLQNKANRVVVQDFVRAFPDAVRMADGDIMVGGGGNHDNPAAAAVANSNSTAATASGTYASFQLDGYPLHVACSVRQDEGEIIALLAHSFPDATRCKNQGGYLPLHLMLEYRGVTPALEGVQALVRLYPESTILKAPSLYPPPVFSVFSLHASHCTGPVVETILSHVPRHVTSLQFPIGCFTDDTVQPHHARALTRVLPQLQQLELCPPQWHAQGWETFAATFRFPLAISNLRQLVLKAPKFNPTAAAAAAALSPSPPRQQSHSVVLAGVAPALLTEDGLCHLLQNLTNLQSLNLMVDYHPQEGRNITQPLAHLLTHGQLRQLRVDGFPLQLPVLYQALQANVRLQQLVLNDLVVPQTTTTSATTNNNNIDVQQQPSSSSSSSQLLRLSDVLRQGNVTLQTAATVSFTGQLGDEYSQIQYWASLNRLGRAVARHADATVDMLVQLLVNASNDDVLLRQSNTNNNGGANNNNGHANQNPAVAASVDRDVQSIVYGLLRESPGSWSNSTGCANNPIRDGSGAAAGDVEMQNADSDPEQKVPSPIAWLLSAPAKRPSVASPVTSPRKRKIQRPFGSGSS